MTMNNNGIEELFDHIDKTEDQFLDRLMQYLKHPSISAHNHGIQETAAILAEILGQIGLEAEIIPTRNHPVVLGWRNVSPDKPTILFYGHYDVIPPDPLELWESPPFTPTIRNGRIYARGVGDNKGQHFAQLLAVETYLKVHGTLPCNVIFLIEGEEEIGSPNLADFIRDNASRLDADLAIISDGSLHPSGVPTITFGARGIASFELRARTANRDVHSGNFGGIVPNAIWKLVHLLATMKNSDGEILIEGLNEKVTPPSARERQILDQLPVDVAAIQAELGLSELDAPKDRGYYDRLMFHPTLTVNGFHGGYDGPSLKTVLPCEAFVKCDMRLVGSLTPDYVFEKVKAHIDRYAPDIEFIPLIGVTPSRTPIDSPFAEPIQKAIIQARGIEPLLYPMMGGTLPNHVFTDILNIPAFMVPYANADQANHAPNENLEIGLFIDGIKTGCALLAELGQPKRDMEKN